MNQLDMAKSIMGSVRYNPGQTTTAYGVATADSADGLVMVDMGGDTVSPDDDQSIECETTFKVYEDDEVIVSLIGADGSGKTPIVIGVVGRGDEEANKAEELKNRAEELKDQIIETAEETLASSIGSSEQIMQELYLSKSDAYGTFSEQIDTKIENTARQIQESFNYSSLVASIDNVEQYLTVINGEIRRGFVDINGVKTFGIVVASENVFAINGGTYNPGGDDPNTYYEIASNKCFGLYTATGWQYWNDMEKLAWFDISTGQLHVNNINIESNFIMGNWQMTEDGSSWGIKYIG